jgi:hypothetical protein
MTVVSESTISYKEKHMKKLVSIFAVLSLFLASCSYSSKIDTPNGQKQISYYGLFSEETDKNPNIHYKVSPYNVVIGAIFCETIIVPVVVIGWQLYEPVRYEGVGEAGEAGEVKQ